VFHSPLSIHCSVFGTLQLGSFLPRDAMHKRGLCRRAVSARASRSYSVEKSKHIFKKISPSDSHTILAFPYQTLLQYSDLTRASNAGIVGENNSRRRISGFIACCKRCYRHMFYTQLRRTVASWRHSSLVPISGGVVCCLRR